jgi:mono/diheme cytochrome c family protein
MRRAGLYASTLVALSALVPSGPARAAEARPLPRPDFDRTVAPLLLEQCIDCHGGAKPRGGLDLTRKASALRGGKGGPAIVPGRPADSLLWQRIRDGEMPPKKPLAAADRAILEAWIAAGAPWGSDPINPFRFTTSKRAGADWWSLQPVRRPALPAVRNPSWGSNPIDRFVLARLEASGLAPSPKADRRTLARRLFFDLVGLPPTPEEVEAFVGDRSPDAWERLVDRLLASPHHGERWARHWLDVVRFGESDGFERNAPRPAAWPYRDWVIRAVNDDLPYDDFCRLQIAGDVLRPGDTEAVRAIGFLVAGIHNTVVPANRAAQEAAFQDEMEDLIGTVGQTFLGLTVNCGRCHDHKFDPISQQDYYRLASALSGVRHGEREVVSTPARAELARLQTEAERLEKQLAAIEEPARQAAQAEGKEGGRRAPTPLAAWDFREGGRDRAGGLDVRLVGGARFTPAGLVVDGKGGFARSGPLPRSLREKTLEAWVRLDGLGQRGGGVFTVQTPDGNVFDAVVFGEQEPGRWLAGSDFFRRTASFGAPAEEEAARRPVHVAIAWHSDGTVSGYRDGRPHGRPYRSTGPVTFEAGKTVVAFGVRHEPAGGNRLLAGTIVQARLYDRALTAEEVAASAAGGPFLTEAELLARLTPQARRQREGLRDRLASIAAERARLAGRLAGRLAEKVYAAVPQQPAVTHLLLRGQAASPADVVAPGGLAALARVRPDFGLPPDAPEAERRRKLAAWLTHPDNPLFARVMVNRLWHYHFGVGLVETPSDLGFNGGRPSHPELLDWLAAEFAARRYSLKAMHRLICTSAAYRQASAPRSEGLAADADTRLVWRRRPLRVEGEVLRDGMLTVAGLLQREVGGRGFSDYRISDGKNGTTYYDPIDAAGPAFHRRSIYRFTPRGGNPGLLEAFDCPDPAAAAPRRNTTTTPLQALALWNSSFALRMAESFAARLATEAPGDVPGQVVRAYRLAFQRDPLPAERDAAVRLVRRHGLRALCRALFNTNEFLTVG